MLDSSRVFCSEVAAAEGLGYGSEFARRDGGERMFCWLVGWWLFAHLAGEDAACFGAEGETL
jgi:hypothetical protein